MKIIVAESEVKPVIRAVYERLLKISKNGEPDEEQYNLYRVLHRYRSEMEEEEPVPEVISREDIAEILKDIREIEQI